MNVILTLNDGLGVDLGPDFDLSVNTGTITPNNSNLTDLLDGIIVNVDDAATSITITSIGTCTNSLILPITS